MTPRARETVLLAVISLLIAAVIVGLILVVFLVSGNQELLSQMLQNTVEGELLGIIFTAGGPFGMWVIAFVLLIYILKRSQSLGAIRLMLRFPDSPTPPPSQPAHFNQAKCWYSVFSNGQTKFMEQEVPILTIQSSPGVYAPYIYVKAPGVEDPEFQVRLEYEQTEWFSDSYSPKKGGVDLR